MMKFLKAIILPLLVISFTLQAGAQDLLRHSYKSNGYTYVGSERTLVKAGSSDKHPFYEKLEYVIFPDGETTAYILEIDIEEERAYNFPKEVQLNVTTQDNKIHTFKQYAGATTDKHQFTAADGKTKVYWNVGKYMLEESDVANLISGVKHLEIAYSWEPDGFYAYNYSKDEFSKALADQVEVIRQAVGSAQEIGDIIDYVDNLGSTTIVARPLKFETDNVDLTVQMTYLYYKTDNNEDYDLTILLSKEGKEFNVPYESELEFTLGDGRVISLKQERETESVVFMFPTIDQVKAMIQKGIKSVSIPQEGGPFVAYFNDNQLSKAISSLYNTLQAVSVL